MKLNVRVPEQRGGMHERVARARGTVVFGPIAAPFLCSPPLFLRRCSAPLLPLPARLTRLVRPEQRLGGFCGDLALQPIRIDRRLGGGGQ
jgi:hypothetical protein